MNEENMQSFLNLISQLENAVSQEEREESIQDFMTVLQDNEELLVSMQAASESSSGTQFYQQGKYIEAIICWKAALKIYRQICDRQGEGSTLYNCGVAYYDLGDYEGTIECHQQSQEIFEALGDSEGKAKSLGFMGKSYIGLGKYQLGIEYLQQALVICRKNHNIQDEFITLLSLGNGYKYIYQYDQAITLYQQCLNIAKSISDRQGEGKALDNLAMIYSDQGKYQIAIKYHQQSLAIFEDFGDIHDVFIARNCLGNTYDNIGDYPRAIANYEQNLRLAENLNDEYKQASSLGNLAGVYKSLGEYQKAIAYRQQSLEIFTELEIEKDRAIALNALGGLYSYLGENQRSLDYHQQSLNIYQDLGDMDGRAATLGNLGNTYHALAEYQKSIDYHQQSLDIYRQIGAKKDEAICLGGLGEAYHAMGEYEQAEKLCQQSLAIHKEIGNRSGEAGALNNLGVIYLAVGNYHQAIDIFEQSLALERQLGRKNNQAGVLNNLGNIYQSQGKEQRAIDLFQQSLEIFRNIGNREGEATSLDNLGNVCYSLKKHQEAIEYHQQSLIITREIGAKHGEGGNLNNLANNYHALMQYEKALELYQQSLEISQDIADRRGEANSLGNIGNTFNTLKQYQKAIEFYQQSLQISHDIGDKVNEASLLNNLANVYIRLEQIPQAIQAYEETLNIATPATMPIECASAGRNLGTLAFKLANWQLAISGYSSAIKAVETIRAGAITDTRREEIVADAIDAYFGIVQALINLYQQNQDIENLKQAIEYIERSKARNLIELLANRDIYPKGEFSPAIMKQLDSLRRKIVTEQKRLAIEERNRQLNQLFWTEGKQTQTIKSSSQQFTQINQLQQQLDELITREITPIDPTFSLTQTVTPISFPEIQSLIDRETAILEWYITSDRLLCFLITIDSLQPILIEDSTELLSWTQNYLTAYYTDKQQWIKDLETNLSQLAQILHLDTIITHIPRNCDRLIIIPHRILHLLPLHGLPVDGKNLLFDIFPRGVQYAPSCQLLKLAQAQPRQDFQHLFALQNPTEDLMYADLEVTAISSLFPTTNILAKKAATQEAVKTQQDFSSIHCSHFSCHGTFNPLSPLESALILSNKIQLSLGEIFTFSLPNCRLVTLSACETGLIDVESVSDEYIGLPNGFLFAGSPTVVSSLWTVSDLSTAFLMIKFYENLQLFPHRKAGEVATALNQAQQWLRHLTVEKLDRFLEQYQSSIDTILNQLRPGKRLIFQESLHQIRQRQPLPFANVYYWGAFTTVGF